MTTYRKYVLPTVNYTDNSPYTVNRIGNKNTVSNDICLYNCFEKHTLFYKSFKNCT